jgi:hypothetical protein
LGKWLNLYKRESITVARKEKTEGKNLETQSKKKTLKRVLALPLPSSLQKKKRTQNINFHRKLPPSSS